MDRKTKWRTFWLSILVLWAVVTLLPSILGDDVPSWIKNSTVLNKKIRKGLDLQGGLHLTYRLDLDRAVKDKANELKREFEAQLDDLSIKGNVSTVGPVIQVSADDDAGFERIQAKTFLKDYNEFLVKTKCPTADSRSLCIKVSTDYAEGVKKRALKQAVETIRERLTARAVGQPSVRAKNDQIIVELPGHDPEETEDDKDIIQRAAKLEFKMVVETPEGAAPGARDYSPMEKIYRFVGNDPAATADKKRLIGRDIDNWAHRETGRGFSMPYLRAENTKQWFTEADAISQRRPCSKDPRARRSEGKVECAVTGREILETYLGTNTDKGGTSPEGSLFARQAELAIPAGFQIGFEYVEPQSAESKEEPYWRTIYLNDQVELGGSAIRRAYFGFDPQSGRPEVYIDFNRYGAKRFGEITGKNIGRRFAIILDDKVTSAPTIQSAITGGSARITLGGSNPQEQQEEAEKMVGVLETGSLPAPLLLDTESEVGSLLGPDAIRKAQISFLLGSVLVILIMIGYYRTSGFISIVALVLNLTFMMAILAGFQATLTLPGIAALVLTVGMAVDANIIIYERIREELRAGKSVRGAVDAGFSRGLAAIIDGNLTTGVAAYVLYQYGSGPIKGFAVMLLIGIICTLFTATWCTRLFFEYYVGRGKNKPIAI